MFFLLAPESAEYRWIRFEVSLGSEWRFFLLGEHLPTCVASTWLLNVMREEIIFWSTWEVKDQDVVISTCLYRTSSHLALCTSEQYLDFFSCFLCGFCVSKTWQMSCEKVGVKTVKVMLKIKRVCVSHTTFCTLPCINRGGERTVHFLEQKLLNT